MPPACAGITRPTREPSMTCASCGSRPQARESRVSRAAFRDTTNGSTRTTRLTPPSSTFKRCGKGPIGLLASCHLDSAIPNFLIQECCGNIVPQPRDKVWLEWFGFPAMRMVNGKYPLTDKPGLGFDLTEAALAKYPFGGTKPMARVFFQDGSVGEW